MMAKVIRIRTTINEEEIESEQLHASKADLDASLKRLAEDHPRLVALSWIIKGVPGSLTLHECIDGGMVTTPTWKEQAQTLAWAVNWLPEPLRAAFEAEFDAAKGSQAIEVPTTYEDEPASEE